MKKRFYVILTTLLVCGTSNLYGMDYSNGVTMEASDTLSLRLGIAIDENTGHPFPHSIVKKPQIMFDGHTLYLISGCDNTTIVLRDEDGQTVYTEFITPETESVELPENHYWAGGSEADTKGILFNANMPTEEVFTLPKRTGVNGIVFSSKPLSYNGNLINDFSESFMHG